MQTPVYLLVLNYNGRELLEACLPSIELAASRSRYACRVAVVDNNSTDGSPDWLARHFPNVELFRCANRGLCSYNEVVAQLPGRVAVLLNNDIRLAPDALDPLLTPLMNGPSPATGADSERIFLTAPCCWLFDGESYEGFRTGVGWRHGVVQATARFTGHERLRQCPGRTASAGAVMAIDCDVFRQLGGFDSVYLPGRIEDLDYCFRAWQAGYVARYVPESVAWHRGHASFGACFGQAGSDRLALRNTLIFQWRRLRHPLHLARHLAGLPLRLAYDLVRAPWQATGRRWIFTRALVEALLRLAQHRQGLPSRKALDRERAFFTEFDFRRLAKADRGEAWS